MHDGSRRVVLIVQDGWGIAPPAGANCIARAKTPFFDRCLREYPHAKIASSGSAVGLPEGVQGNSEVGHLHIGAGRIIWQMYERISREIRNGSFAENPVLRSALTHSRTLHLIGLCSDGGVHSHTEHLFAVLDAAKAAGISDVRIHFIADGRDVPERSADEYATKIERKLAELGVGKIVSLIGRFSAMDRDKNWDRTKQAYELLMHGKGERVGNIHEGIAKAYAQGAATDYYIGPTMLERFAPIKDGESVFFFNYRTDRPRQLVHAFVDEVFDGFARGVRPDVLVTTMTQYEKTLSCPYLFSEVALGDNLGSTISRAGLRQLRIAETEKYAHVTYFFNTQVEIPYAGEERLMVPSSKVPSYDLKPEMSAREIAAAAIEKISSEEYDFILLNFANCDLVGHAGVQEAVIAATEIVDACTAEVVSAALSHDYVVYLTADHGNAEEMEYPSGEVKPSHTTNPVNAFLISNDPDLKRMRLRDGEQQDAAPTILALMGLPKPEGMTGRSLLER